MTATARRRSSIPPPAEPGTVADRVAFGTAQRDLVGLSEHAAVERSPKEPSAVKLLREQDADRVAELVPIRYGRMMASPFTFLRGAARVMAADLAAVPRTGLTVQLCGDAHLANFGFFGTPERRLVFDTNDFDETRPGPFEWDLKRLVASLAVAARSLGLHRKQVRKILLAAAGRYRAAMAEFAEMRDVDVWYARVDTADLRRRLTPEMGKKQLTRLEGVFDRARRRDSVQDLGKLTEVADGHRRIAADPPLVVPLRDLLTVPEHEDMHQRFRQLVDQYRRSLQPDRRILLERYRFIDMARKVVGVGSVGTRCWIILLTGRDENDPLFLQIKEAGFSVLAEFLGRSEYANQGERVVSGQRLMQQSSDVFLGWQRTTGIDDVRRDFYVRQLRDWKGSIDFESLKPKGMALYAQVCAWSLARAHARSGDRIAIAAYLGPTDRFDGAIADFGEAYAELCEADHRALVDAVATGTVAAERDL